MLDKDVKEPVSTVHQIKSVWSFIKTYWAAIVFVGGILTTVAGTTINLWYTGVVEPKMTTFVRDVAGEYAKDSLPNFIDNHLSTKGGGFRGRLSNYVDATDK